MYLCVRYRSVSMIFFLDFGTVPSVWYFCFSNYYFSKVGDKSSYMIKEQVNRIGSFKRLFINSKQKRYAVFILSCTFHILEKCRYFFIVTCIRLSIDASIKSNCFLISLISNNLNIFLVHNTISSYLHISIIPLYNTSCTSLLKHHNLY